MPKKLTCASNKLVALMLLHITRLHCRVKIKKNHNFFHFTRFVKISYDAREEMEVQCNDGNQKTPLTTTIISTAYYLIQRKYKYCY